MKPNDREHPSDRELWERAASGEHDAFGQLFDRHARPVYNFLFRRTASWADAEDLTSAVFLTAWKRLERIRLDRDSALPWLLKVADYCANNQRRASKRYRNAVARVSGQPLDQPDHADNVVARVDDEHAMVEVRRALRELPAGERAVIELCVWTGLDHQAAAVTLGVPVGTVKSRLSRARGRLRNVLISPYLVEEEVQ